MSCLFLKWHAEMIFCASVRSIARHTLAQLTQINLTSEQIFAYLS